MQDTNKYYTLFSS